MCQAAAHSPFLESYFRLGSGLTLPCSPSSCRAFFDWQVCFLRCWVFVVILRQPELQWPVSTKLSVVYTLGLLKPPVMVTSVSRSHRLSLLPPAVLLCTTHRSCL